MELTGDFKQTVRERLSRDSEFAKWLLAEADTLFLGGDLETARLVLYELVHTTIGFEQCFAMAGKPGMDLRHMWPPKGNPSKEELVAIMVAVRAHLIV